MTLQNKYQKDKNGNKYAPIITLNVIRWPNESNLNDKLSAFNLVVIKDIQSQVGRNEYGNIT